MHLYECMKYFICRGYIGIQGACCNETRQSEHMTSRIIFFVVYVRSLTPGNEYIPLPDLFKTYTLQESWQVHCCYCTLGFSPVSASSASAPSLAPLAFLVLD